LRSLFGAVYALQRFDLVLLVFDFTLSAFIVTIDAGGQPEYHCQVPEGALVNETIPTNKKGHYVQCKMFVSSSSNDTTECTDYEYFGDIGETIVSEVIMITRILSCLKTIFIRPPVTVVREDL